MNLFRATFTGADDLTALEGMVDLSRRYHFIEWGILFSPDREGNPRYPSSIWRNSLISKANKMHLSAHLCGRAIDQFIEHDESLFRELAWFDRIQLNINMKMYEKRADDLVRAIALVCKPTIIQENTNNSGWWDVLAGHQLDIQVLYDQSAGCGVMPERWDPPKRVLTGYAGGLSLNKLDDALPMIIQEVKDKPFWIDMETGIRIDNVLDLGAVESIVSRIGDFR